MRCRHGGSGLAGHLRAMASVSNDWVVSSSDQPCACRTRVRSDCVSASAWSSASSVQIDRTYTGVALALGGSACAGRASAASPADAANTRAKRAWRAARVIDEEVTRLRARATTRVRGMRVTGGRLRSRALVAPRGTGTRPTTDRVREALFGILASAGRLDGARVLDLYAGTGALAIEALSRGAARATLVESGREALAAARANVAALGLAASAQILAADMGAGAAARRVARAGPFDLVLADPPWSLVDTGEVARALADLVSAGALAAGEAGEAGEAGALVVLEHSTRTDAAHLLIRGLLAERSRRYGDSTLTFYKPAILAPQRPDDAGPIDE